MLKKINAVKARQTLGQIMNEVALRGDDYIVERAGKPMVAIIPIEKYWDLQKNLDNFGTALDRVRAGVAKEDSAIIDEAVKEAVRETRRQVSARNA